MSRPNATIARIWRGRTKAGKADEYARYLYEKGIRPLEEKALGVQMLRENGASESESSPFPNARMLTQCRVSPGPAANPSLEA